MEMEQTSKELDKQITHTVEELNLFLYSVSFELGITWA